MQISDLFKQTIKNTFYDKKIEIWTSGTVTDDEGAVIGNGKKDKVEEFDGNFQFSTREYIQKEYGMEIEANAIVTCDKTVAKEGDILVYADMKPSNLLLSRYTHDDLQQYTHEQLTKEIAEREYIVKSVISGDSHFTILVERNGGDV